MERTGYRGCWIDTQQEERSTHLVDNLGPIHFLNRLLTQLGQVLREALNIKKGSKLDGWKEFGQYI